MKQTANAMLKIVEDCDYAQNKTVGGKLDLFWACRLFMVVILYWFGTGCVYADANKTPDKQSKQAEATQIEAIQEPDPCHLNNNPTLPAMIAIKPSYFNMGSSENETGRSTFEGPVHQVSIPRPFAISRCEITVKQFKQFIDETGYKTSAESVGNNKESSEKLTQQAQQSTNSVEQKTKSHGCYVWNVEKKDWQQQADRHWRSPGFTQQDNYPVVCISWDDAQYYVAWLSQRTGAIYRLPSEAEWEYAARAAADPPVARYFQDKSQCEYANGLGQEAKSIADKSWVLADCADGYIYTAPVGSFKANAFGLHDMLGNALEWTVDCWHQSYDKAPLDGSAWLQTNAGECDRRVVRGGSWYLNPQNLRSAIRYRNDTDAASIFLGFRVARAL